jgi:hypothetical protein
MTKKIIRGMAFTAIFLTLAGGLFALGAVGDEGVCERALYDCVNDLITQATGFIGATFCIVGYTFCKRYIDPGI